MVNATTSLGLTHCEQQGNSRWYGGYRIHFCPPWQGRLAHEIMSGTLVPRHGTPRNAMERHGTLCFRKDQRFPLEIISPWFTPSKKPIEAIGIILTEDNPIPRCNYPPEKKLCPYESLRVATSRLPTCMWPSK